MVPAVVRITSGDPALAHAMAHSALTGFFNPLVNAQAESTTYPFIVMVFPASPAANIAINKSPGPTTFNIRNFIF
jgi:hypothetical protein